MGSAFFFFSDVNLSDAVSSFAFRQGEGQTDAAQWEF